MNDTQQIPGIYNYCDRWCERCPFTSQCSIYDPEEIDTNNWSEGFFDLMEEILDDTLELIREAIIEEDPEGWDKLMEEILLLPDEMDNPIQEEPALVGLGRQYFELSEQWLDTHQEILVAKEVELNQKQNLGVDVSLEGERINDALEVIQWYLFFISAKIHRAVNGLKDKDMMALMGHQNDANGSAKIALIAIERSLTAWETLRSYFPETTDSMLDVLVLLTKLRLGLQQLFPETDKFVRPGFDEMGSAVSDV